MCAIDPNFPISVHPDYNNHQSASMDVENPEIVIRHIYDQTQGPQGAEKSWASGEWMIQKLWRILSIWVCLKMLCTPLYPMVLLIIIPTKWL